MRVRQWKAGECDVWCTKQIVFNTKEWFYVNKEMLYWLTRYIRFIGLYVFAIMITYISMGVLGYLSIYKAILGTFSQILRSLFRYDAIWTHEENGRKYEKAKVQIRAGKSRQWVFFTLLSVGAEWSDTKLTGKERWYIFHHVYSNPIKNLAD